jgi:hypothetical protein
MTRPRALSVLTALALLAGCGSDNREAGGVTGAEAEALDEAAEMLEGERIPAEAIPPPANAPSPGASPAPTAQAAPGG